MPQPPFDIATAHRWFAIELNNLAWDLIESDSRVPEDLERMIHAAHAACFHWLQVGTPLNHQRAQCLLATAYAVAGHPEAAVRHAERCLELSRANGSEQSAFDLATAHGCASRAYAALGQRDQAAKLSAEAVKYLADFEHPEDRDLFAKLYPAP